MSRLTDAEREFLVQLADVAFSNPFSRKRAELIVRMAPGAPLGDLTANREALARVASARLGRLLEQPVRLAPEERRLLE